jgi:hypothetical protein
MFGFGGAGTQAPRLEIKQLFEKRQVRDSAKLRAYNQILAQIHNRIYAASQLAGNSNSIVYTVPPFILGLPALDLEDCIVYLVTMLRNGGFVVKYTYPNLLYISWKHYEQEYNSQQNPIVKAMMPPAEPTTKKGKEGKRGTSSGNDRAQSVTFATAPIFAPERQAVPARSAAAYQPPDAFVQSMTRPAARSGGGSNSGSAQGGKGVADVLSDLWKM